MRLTFSLRMIIDFLSDQLTVTFIGISSPPWNKDDDDVCLFLIQWPHRVMHTKYIHSILLNYIQPLRDRYFQVSLQSQRYQIYRKGCFSF